ncbi:MAG: dockerin type I repeat-containing protein [Phycisphaerae bacterium]|nr:dockerin type I repeat-containing protein [Phycisphaerae bacterium]
MPRHRFTSYVTVHAGRRLQLSSILAGPVIGSLVAAITAHADLTFAVAPAPGGFVQACAGPATNGVSWPGADHFLFYPPQFNPNLVEESFVGDTTGDLNAAFAGDGVTNSSHAVAGLGLVHGSASNNAPDAAFFPAGIAHGGWSETFVITNRALTGQAGFMQFTLDVQGSLFAAGLTGSSVVTVTGYKDGAQLEVNPFFDPGDSDPLISTTHQFGHWGIATFGNPPTESLTVNDTVTFAVPFTFGTPFKLGIYANIRAGMRSSGGQGGTSSAQTNFDEGITWGGITQVTHDMTPIDDYTIASGSGIDWTQPIDGGDPADLDGNGVVNSADLAILLGGWGTSAGDINGDGTTNATDLALLLAAWN